MQLLFHVMKTLTNPTLLAVTRFDRVNALKIQLQIQFS